MKLSKSALDRLLGLEVYATDSEGIGGRIRARIEDFWVEEIAPDGTPCTLAKDGEGGGEYTWFVMEKRGVDTITALRIIARAYGISSRKFSAAGLKDTKAVAYQLACVKGLDPGALRNFTSEAGRVRILSAFRRPFRLRPGMLYGNRFTVTVRDIDCSRSTAEERLRGILGEIGEAGGIPNFYGYQRFGTVRPNTHIIGKFILRGMFREAVEELLLNVYPREPRSAKEARKYLAETWDLRGALELFPRRLHYERMIIHYLLKHPGDYFGSIRTLPLAVRRLFVGAYQAYLFNKILSRRIIRGIPYTRAVPGDFVALLDRRRNIRGILVANSWNVDKLNGLIKAGGASLVLNLYGYDSTIPRGTQGEIEIEVLRDEDLSIDSFRLRKMPEISSKGSYRVASFLPEKLSYIFVEERSLTFSFVLLKGVYATVFLREVIKPNDIIDAGF